MCGRDPDLYEELVQEMNLSLLAYKGNIREQAYLCRIAINAGIDFIRVSKYGEVLEEKSESDVNFYPPKTDIVCEGIDIESYLSCLSPRNRDIFLLMGMGYTCEEIGTLYGIKKSAISLRLKRSRKTLNEVAKVCDH